MQFIRDLCRNEEITPIQFRILVPLVDTSNEGTDNDSSRWGKSWLSLENLAKESGCSKRAVEKNLPKLEAAGIVKVWRDLDDQGRATGGKSNVNEYWLCGWNKFGAILDEENSERRSPYENGNSERGTEKQRTTHRGTANAGPENGEQRSPDSTYSPHSETQPTDPTQSAPASGERGLAVGSVDDDRPRTKPANDNLPHDWPADWRDQFWSTYPVRKNTKAAEAALVSVAKSGVTFEAVLTAARRYDTELHDRARCKDPVNWLADEPWKDNVKAREQARRTMRPSMGI